MDPWYFLDLESNIKDENDEEVELNEICEIYPDGSWTLKVGDGYTGHIKFKEVSYPHIEYNNNTKRLNCHYNSEVIFYYNLKVE
jgi:hypothetical protein